MRKSLTCFLLLLGVLVGDPAAGFAPQKKAQNPKDKIAKEKTTEKDYADLAKLKEVVGKIREFDIQGGTLVLRLEGVRYEPNPSAQDAEGVAAAKRGVDRLQQQVQEFLKTSQVAGSAQARQQALLQAQQLQPQLQQALATLAAAQKKMLLPVIYAKDFEFNVLDKVKVGRSKLDPKVDEAGVPIKYSAEELKKLKSPDITSAYSATPEELRVGQTLKVFLIPPKKEVNPKDSKSTDAKNKQEAATTKTLPGRSWVRMALIVDDPYLPPEATKQESADHLRSSSGVTRLIGSLGGP